MLRRSAGRVGSVAHGRGGVDNIFERHGAVRSVKLEKSSLSARPAEPGNSSAALAFRGVGLHIRQTSILRNVTWTVPRGGRAAILGPNGCGKTTLLRIATGYGHSSEGTVELLGETLGDVDVRRLRRRIGVVDPSAANRFDERVTVAQAAATGFCGHFSPWFDEPTPAQQAAADAALTAVGMADRGAQLFNTLSTGERRRVLLARALAPKPELLALDEAAAGLDLAGRENLLANLERALRQRPGLTLLTVTHWLEELPPGLTDVLLLSAGAVVAAGPPEQVLTNVHVSAAYGCPVEVDCRAGRWSWRVAPHAWETLSGP